MLKINLRMNQVQECKKTFFTFFPFYLFLENFCCLCSLIWIALFVVELDKDPAFSKHFQKIVVLKWILFRIDNFERSKMYYMYVQPVFLHIRIKHWIFDEKGAYKVQTKRDNRFEFSKFQPRYVSTTIAITVHATKY